MIRAYYSLTKPGIIRGNAVTAAAGFLLAATGPIDWWQLITMLTGMSLVIASACVYNNYLDRGIDKKMARTRKRALVTGKVSSQSALIFATTLGLIGLLILIAWVNVLTAAIGLFGFFFYVVIYGLAKRKTVHGTLVGTISGATPPVAGYAAVTNHLDGAAVILFLILVFWQMAHFYGIALYRLSDYTKAGLPVLPAVKGVQTTKRWIMLYILAFTLTAASLTIYGYAGNTYLVVASVLGLSWFGLGLRSYNQLNATQWGKRMFLISLLVISLLSTIVALGARLA